jgi:dTDP-4-dehydrorhamnose 3,5-epimerase
MEVIQSNISGVKLILPEIFNDNRGYFYESYNHIQFEQLVNDGNRINFVQDNESCSQKNTIRGLHWQTGNYAQAKLVRCVRGAVIDYAIDLRKSSPTFGQYVHALLTPENKLQFFIPRGFAHGFIALEDDTVFQYKCDNYYNKSSERGLSLTHVNWPISLTDAITSKKDLNYPTLDELVETDLF